jgi:hypothetical protein
MIPTKLSNQKMAELKVQRSQAASVQGKGNLSFH